jgi:hypothetical protein
MKKIILISFVAIIASSCTSGKKENTQASNSSSGDTPITIISPIGGQRYHAGDWIVVKWKSANLPSGTVITVGLDNVNGTADAGASLVPLYAAKSDIYGAVNNSGHAIFQLPIDKADMYHMVLGGVQMSYGKTFKIGLMAFRPSVPSVIIASAHSDFFTVTAH